MGVVYEAEQQKPVRRIVALKLIKLFLSAFISVIRGLNDILPQATATNMTTR